MEICLPEGFTRSINKDASVYDVNGRYMPHNGGISVQDLYTHTEGIVLDNEYIADEVHIWMETAQDKDEVVANLRAQGTTGKIVTGVIYYTIVFESAWKLCCFTGKRRPLCEYRRVLAVREEEIGRPYIKWSIDEKIR